MGRGRSAGYDDQRELILECAAKLFAQRGYTATSVNQVAEACGLSKAALYHYYKDKYSLLVSIAETHVSRLECIVEKALLVDEGAEHRMRRLIGCLVEEYANAQNAHRVLTEDVKFLNPEDRQRILDKERKIVEGFASVVVCLRPDLAGTATSKPLTMLLFGMVNWLFTWMKPDGELNYLDIGPIVQDLFLGGLASVKPPHDQPLNHPITESRQ